MNEDGHRVILASLELRNRRHGEHHDGRGQDGAARDAAQGDRGRRPGAAEGASPRTFLLPNLEQQIKPFLIIAPLVGEIWMVVLPARKGCEVRTSGRSRARGRPSARQVLTSGALSLEL